MKETLACEIDAEGIPFQDLLRQQRQSFVDA
jgi:hypothetical protein